MPGGQHLGHGGTFEAVQQFPDRLVDPGDPRDGLGARDDAHLIGVVAGVVGLPQRVTAPPAADVLVDHRHEVHRLARDFAQIDEVRCVGGVQQHRVGVRIALQQRVDGSIRVLQQGGVAEDRLDGAGVRRIQAGLGTLQHRAEPVPPGDIQPRRVDPLGVGGSVTGPDREFHVASQPLQVGHFGDVAEVRLGRSGHSGDDLVAPRLDGLGVTGDLVEQPAAAGCGVVDLVDVGAKLTASGSHAAAGFSGSHPVFGAGGVDQQLLDRRRGGGLQAGHRGGTHQDSVHRHQWVAVGQRPAPGEVLGGPLRCADTAADANGDVGLRAHLRIRHQQQVVEVLPGVVAAGAAALDVSDHRLAGHLGGDPDHRPDLFDGAGLEADVGDTCTAEFVEEFDGLVEFGDAGADDQSVDGRSGLTGLLHQAFSTDLELPQIGVEEQRVELDGPAGLEHFGQLDHPALEDRLGDLSAAGQFGPVAAVGGGGNDAGIYGGGGHAGQQDR